MVTILSYQKYTAAQDEDHVHEIFMIEHAGNFERAIGMANSCLVNTVVY